jgi:hypothetical protein
VPELDLRDEAADPARIIEDVPAPLRARGRERDAASVRDIDAEAQLRAARRVRRRRASAVVSTMVLVVAGSAAGLAVLIAGL